MSKINVSLLETLDASIKSGHAKSAKDLLRDLRAKDIPQSLLGHTAKILNRCGLPKKVTRLLDEIIYPEDTLKRKVTDIELAEYGSALNQIGAYTDSLAIFAKVNVKAAPMVEFYHALTLFNRWEYQKAIPHLQSFSENPKISEYERYMGKVNLVVAHLAMQNYNESYDILNKIEAYAKKSNLKLLLGKCLELRGQALIEQGRFKNGAKYLEAATSLLKNSSAKNLLVLEKWTTIAKMGLLRDKYSMAELKKLKLKAVELDHWKTVRECDFYEALFTKNDALFLKVYFGTPFEAFRQRLKSVYNEKINLPESYLWNPMNTKIPEGHKIISHLALDFRTQKKLKTGHLLNRLFQFLASDFYVPFRTETLFNCLFPNERFNPQTSNNRVYFALSRLSNWLSKLNIPIEVRHQTGGYRLFVTEPYGIEVKLNSPLEISQDLLSQLKIKFQSNDGFTAAQAAKILDIPHRTLNRKLGDLVNEGRLMRKGLGPSTKYYFSK